MISIFLTFCFHCYNIILCYWKILQLQFETLYILDYAQFRHYCNKHVTMVSWFRWWVDLDFLLLSFLINIYRNQPNPSQNLFCLDSINFFVSSNIFIRNMNCKQIHVNSSLNSTHHCDKCLLQLSIHEISKLCAPSMETWHPLLPYLE